MTGTKERVLFKYLKKYMGKGFCPTQRGVSILVEGRTNVHTGSIQWKYKGKEREETVDWSAKDLH
jgi:hypothetical protein